MAEFPQIHFKNSDAFRSWLEQNHDKSNGIWMFYYKKHTKKESITYPEALNEALCFGWIDSTVRRIDEETYVQMFTPRTNIKNWSNVNKLKVIELLKLKKMTDAGLQKIHEYRETGKLSWTTETVKKQATLRKKQQATVPTLFLDAMKNNEPAFSNFQQLAPSFQRHYIQWISSAKRQETIDKRLTEAIALLKNGQKLGQR